MTTMNDFSSFLTAVKLFTSGLSVLEWINLAVAFTWSLWLASWLVRVFFGLDKHRIEVNVEHNDQVVQKLVGALRDSHTESLEAVKEVVAKLNCSTNTSGPCRE